MTDASSSSSDKSSARIRMELSRTSTISGRASELRTLRAALAVENESSSPRVFFIEGESGIGKSTLVERAFQDSDAIAPAKAWIGHAKFDDSSATPPLHVWIEATGRLLAALAEADDHFRIYLYKSFQSSSQQAADYLDILSSVLGKRLSKSFVTRTSKATVGDAEMMPTGVVSSLPPSVATTTNTIIKGKGSSSLLARDSSFERLKLSYRQLYRIIAQYLTSRQPASHPQKIVLWLDDLQWAEPDDIQILDALLGDQLLEGRLIFVGSHRPVSLLHSLNLVKHNSSYSYMEATKTMTLEPLGQSQVSEILQRVLCQTTADINTNEGDWYEMINILEEQSHGNPFYLKVLIQALVDYGLLFYQQQDRDDDDGDDGDDDDDDDDTKSSTWNWNWNLPEIRRQVASTKVELLIAQRILRAGKRPDTIALPLVLSRAAFLGSHRISSTKLLCILEDESGTTSDEGVPYSMDQLESLLIHAEALGLVERHNDYELVGNGEDSTAELFQFTHDRVRESALSFLPRGDSDDKLHMRVGLRLRSLLEEQRLSHQEQGGPAMVSNVDDGGLLFQVVTQLNSGSNLAKTATERLKMADLNVRAAESARRRSAFVSAIHFLRRSLQLLGPNPFEGNTLDFALRAQTELALMEYECGLFNKSISRANVIFEKAPRARDKAAATHLKLTCLIHQKKIPEALDTAISALSDQCGITFPKKLVKIQIARKLGKVKKMLESMTDDDISNLPTIQEERYELASEFLARIGEAANVRQNSNSLDDVGTFSILVSMELSLKRGRNVLTAQTLVSWGFLLAQEGQLDEAYRFGCLGRTLAEHQHGGAFDDRALTLYYACIHHWKHPYIEAVRPLSKALKILWAEGALNAVIYDTKAYLRLMYLSGCRLGTLLTEFRQFKSLCGDFGMARARSLVDPMAQMVANLVGDQHEVILAGEFLQEAIAIRLWRQRGEERSLQLYCFFKMVCAYYFNDYAQAGKLSSFLTRMYLEGADILVPYRFFFRGLVAWTLYSETTRNKHRKVGRTMTAVLERWAEQDRIINCQHLYLILQAERAAALDSTGKHITTVERAYEDAIAASSKHGAIQDEALAWERGGRYFEKIKDTTRATSYLRKARDSYLEWGATAKARQLNKDYPDLMEEDGDTC